MNQRNEAFAEVEALTRTVDKLDERLDQIDRLAGRNANSAASTVTLGMGGVATWIAITACLVMLAVTIIASVFVAFALSDINSQTRELREQDVILQAYINAAYAKPPKEDEE